MKKTMILAAALLALTFTGCGNKTQKGAPQDSAQVEASDSTASTALSSESKATVDNVTAQLTEAIKSGNKQNIISTLANLETIYKNLVSAGKLDEAKAYGSAIKAFINQNAEQIKNVASGNTTIADLVNGIINLPTSAETTAEQAKAAVSADIVNLASPVIAKGATAVATAKDAAALVQNAPAAVKQAATAAATNAANEAAAQAENKANEAVTKAQDKANKEVKKAQDKAANEVNKAQQKANKAVNDAASKALKGIGL